MEETSRLPEGVEWPRYESGDLVMFGDCVENRNGTCTVNSVRFYSGGGVTVYGEDRGSRLVVVTEPVMHEPIRKARPKVFAADGEPLEVGQTVWHVDTGDEFYVSCFSCGTANVSDKKGGGLQLLPSQLTHQRPVLDADGVPIRVGDTVWYRGHIDPLGVRSVAVTVNGPDYVTAYNDYEGKVSAPAEFFTHTKPEPPDSWDSVWMDVSNGCETPQGMERRCRALAERGE